MLGGLFVKKDYIENYYVADIVVLEGGSQSCEVLETNKLVVRDKSKKTLDMYLYMDLDSGYYHQEFDHVYKLCSFGFGWNCCFKIVNSLAYYYPSLVFSKISVEEAKVLFVKVPELRRLIETGRNVEQLIEEQNLEKKVTDDSSDNKKLIKKRVWQ